MSLQITVLFIFWARFIEAQPGHTHQTQEAHHLNPYHPQPSQALTSNMGGYHPLPQRSLIAPQPATSAYHTHHDLNNQHPSLPTQETQHLNPHHPQAYQAWESSVGGYHPLSQIHPFIAQQPGVSDPSVFTQEPPTWGQQDRNRVPEIDPTQSGFLGGSQPTEDTYHSLMAEYDLLMEGAIKNDGVHFTDGNFGGNEELVLNPAPAVTTTGDFIPGLPPNHQRPGVPIVNQQRHHPYPKSTRRTTLPSVDQSEKAVGGSSTKAASSSTHRPKQPQHQDVVNSHLPNRHGELLVVPELGWQVIRIFRDAQDGSASDRINAMLVLSNTTQGDSEQTAYAVAEVVRSWLSGENVDEQELHLLLPVLQGVVNCVTTKIEYIKNAMEGGDFESFKRKIVNRYPQSTTLKEEVERLVTAVKNWRRGDNRTTGRYRKLAVAREKMYGYFDEVKVMITETGSVQQVEREAKAKLLGAALLHNLFASKKEYTEKFLDEIQKVRVVACGRQ